MTSRAETILEALRATLAGALSAPVSRNAVLPERVPAGGMVIVRDGTPGEPEVTLSPLRYHFEHQAEVDLIVDGRPDLRDATFDALKVAVGEALVADRTLGGLCDWVEPEAPAPVEVAIMGGEGMKAATVVVVLHYTSETPLT